MVTEKEASFAGFGQFDAVFFQTVQQRMAGDAQETGDTEWRQGIVSRSNVMAEVLAGRTPHV